MESNLPFAFSEMNANKIPLKINNEESSFAKSFSIQLPYLITFERYSINSEDNFLITTQVGPGYHKHIHLSKVDFNKFFSKKRTLHRHDFFEFMYVLEGEVKQNIENVIYNYSQGECCLLNPNTRHIENLSTDFQVIFLAITEEYLLDIIKQDIMYLPDGTLKNHSSEIYKLVTEKKSNKTYYGKDYLDFYPVAPAVNRIEECKEIFDEMIIETLNQKPGYNLMAKALFARFFSMLESRNTYKLSHIRLNSSAEEFLFIRIAHILEGNHGRISRTELEKVLNYNSDYLNRIVKKFTGMSLLEYGQTIFLKESEQLLINTDKSISEIVRELGFSNRTYFYRIFKQRYGVTPQEYREKIKILKKS